MIFKQEMVDAILSGRKTVTRRRVKYEDTGFEIRRVPCRYRPGKTYAVQPGRGKKGVARILVLSVQTGPLGHSHELSGDEIESEGFPDEITFVKYWWSLYTNWEPDQLVHRIQFELVPDRSNLNQSGGGADGKSNSQVSEASKSSPQRGS